MDSFTQSQRKIIYGDMQAPMNAQKGVIGRYISLIENMQEREGTIGGFTFHYNANSEDDILDDIDSEDDIPELTGSIE